MRVVNRSLGVTLLALLGTLVLAVAWTATTAVQLAATALIMGGTDHSLAVGGDEPGFVESYLQNVINEFINPASNAPTGTGGAPIAGVDIDGIDPDDDVYAVTYPAEFFPVFGFMTFDDSVAVGFDNLTGCVRGTGCTYNEEVAEPPSPANPPVAGGDFVIFGYSQSAVVASLVKADLMENPPPAGTDVSFFFLANPNRPNGGFLSRGPEGLTIPILGVTFSRATPTNSCEVGECFESVDLAAQYDGLGGDAPVALTNIPAVVNAAMGYFLLHGNLANASFDDAVYQGSFGDTDYYLVPAQRLPLLMPFEAVVPSPILTALDTIVRPLIEGGYRRDISPGVPTSVSLLPFHNPVQTMVNVLVAIPTGVDDAIAEATNDAANRPLGTAPVTSPYGVGGPELPDPPSGMDVDVLATSAPTGGGAGDNARASALTDDDDNAGASALTDDDVIADGREDEAAADDVIADGREDEAAEGDGPDEPADDTSSGADTSAGQQPETPTSAEPGDGETPGGGPDSGDAEAAAAA